MNFPFTKYSKIYYIFSIVLTLASIACLFSFGLKFGIEFTGGSIIEAEFKGDRPSNEAITKSLSEFDLGEIIIQPTDEKGMIMRFKGVDEETHQKIILKLKELSDLEEKRFDYRSFYRSGA